MLENDIIEPSNSDWSSPCMLVPKIDGSYRIVADVAIVAATWGDHSMVETTRFILYEILLLETIIIHI